MNCQLQLTKLNRLLAVERGKFTKRHAAGVIPRLHDFMQWLAPFVLVGKMLWQETERRLPGQKAWSAPLPPDLYGSGMNYIADFNQNLSIFRNATHDTET